MVSTKTCLGVVLTSLPILASARVAPRSTIQWGPCEEGEFNTTLTVQCGTLAVPLDYTNPDSKTFDLELLKIAAPIQPSRGSIQLNFGGPGTPARGGAVATAPLLQVLSGGEYDFVAFDPRGTGKTIPFICTEDLYYVGQILGDTRSSNDSDTALRRLWARGTTDGYICQHLGRGNETAEYIGTAFVARDMISVVDALGEDGLLRYWGFSYGTTLGATAAAMFPDRIDKVILDGVQNPHEYYHAHVDFEGWTDSDMVFSHFFTSCIAAGPEKCALAALNKTAAELEHDTWALFDRLREAPLSIGPTVFDLVSIKGLFVGQLKDTFTWPATSQLLAVLLYGSEAQTQAVLGPMFSPATSSQPDHLATFAFTSALWGIHCGDRIPRLASFEESIPEFKRLEETSRLMSDVAAWVTVHCAQWPWHAKETYMGDFHVKTKNPILIAGNIYDAHTPIRSAHNISAGFEGSGLLTVNGTGHCALSAPSECSFASIVAYWSKGILPEPGSVCQAAGPYDGYTWTDVFAALAPTNGTQLERRARWLP
ncbi:alpha/beta hydrolase fold-domain-containing protein [Podospora aff. communis PSN243]|uniref:Alpha/beta hydrolase fold-domain-containing protein n=1 Tax=Podospora aff. communis PSN243 TaxID=3040156 RepID=A0AAV9G956_9PEZI|nr:alpha/beta hydrolase fold-domain-containing protein [Podospora aff. communis PSN243]